MNGIKFRYFFGFIIEQFLEFKSTMSFTELIIVIITVTVEIFKGIKMKKLIKTEFFKLARSESYRRLLVACVLLALVSYSQNRGMKSVFIMTGYEWLCSRQLMGGWALVTLPIFVADYTAAEFANHTFASGLMNGFTRREILRAKMIGCLVGLLGLGLTNAAVGILVTTILNGFGVELSWITVFQMAKMITYYILSLMVSVGGISFLFAVLTKSRIGTIGFSLCATQLLGSVTANVVYILDHMKESVWKTVVDRAFQLTPLYQIDSLLSPQEYKQHPFWLFLLSCSIVLIVTYLVSMNIFIKSDLR